MPSFRTAYLIHGDDHGRISERRAKLRAMAESAAGTAGVEVYEADQCTPENIAAALSAMTFAMGRRFVIADGVERWKDADVDPVAQALHAADPETLTVAFFAREEGRYKAPAKLVTAVEKAGGQIAAEMNVKAWDLPKWLIEQAKGLDLELDRDGAKALVAQVGDRQQRLHARTREARARVRRRRQHRRARGRRVLRHLGRAQGLDARRRARRRGPPERGRAPARAARAGRARHRPDLQHGPAPA